MKQVENIHKLVAQDRQGKQVFTRDDLATLFRENNPRALQTSLSQLIRGRFLVRAANGVYVNNISSRSYANTLQSIAIALRRGEYNYISLESALSEWGVISQIPMRLTVMTTGRRGEFHTPLGIIEFTHTVRPVHDILNGILKTGKPLRIADKHKAMRDLRRVGRNLHLIDEEVLYEDD